MRSELEKRTIKQGAEAHYRDGRLYDHLYRRRRQDVQFYVELARAHGGPVLELGVGSGRVALAIARAGHEVVGVDAMASMLAQARARLRKEPRRVRDRMDLRQGDLRNVELERRFPLVIAPFNVFQHLYTRRDLERALHNCHRHLRADGLLAFDVMLPDPASLSQNPAKLYKCRPLTDPGDGLRYDCYEASHYDPHTQIRTVNTVLESPTGATRAIPLAQRQFFPAELEALLHYNRFRLISHRGDFAAGAVTEASESQVIVARPSRA